VALVGGLPEVAEVVAVSLPAQVRPGDGLTAAPAACVAASSPVSPIAPAAALREVDLLLWVGGVFTRYQGSDLGCSNDQQGIERTDDEAGRCRAVLVGTVSTWAGESIHVSRGLEALRCRVVLCTDDPTETLRMGLLAAARGQAYCSLSVRSFLGPRRKSDLAPLGRAKDSRERGSVGGDPDTLAAAAADLAPPRTSTPGIAINLAAGILGIGSGQPGNSTEAEAPLPSLPRPSPEASAFTLPAPWIQLSPREAEVARLAAAGLTNAEIGRRLFLSPETVRTYLTRAFDALGVRRRSQLHLFLPTALPSGSEGSLDGAKGLEVASS
jgi:DNA-binding CsgD family transcriptional regulator